MDLLSGRFSMLRYLPNLALYGDVPVSTGGFPLVHGGLVTSQLLR
jgi:hypothetical protein